nr:LRR receptor-like serine/threonine-protein kinase ERL1 [Ipomoea trifida]
MGGHEIEPKCKKINKIGLESLDLGNNKFNINIFKSLKRFPSLKILNLVANDFQGPLHIQDINALNSLEDLDLSDNSFGNFEISTSPAGVSGENKNNSDLQLHLNNISANMTKLLQSLASLPSIKGLELQGNNINTSIEPIHGWCELRNLQELYFIGNQLEGMLPSSLGNLTTLRLVDFSFNMLTGNIGSSPLSTLASVEYLSISDNYIDVPSSFRFLYLDGNNFTGNISDSLSNMSFDILDISDNKFSGKIPRWIRDITTLEQLTLSKNRLEGHILVELCYLHLLSVLDFSANNLTGSIPSCLNPESITHVRLSQNHLEGPLTRAFFNNTALVILDLSYNGFVGRIPEWIGSISRLSILLLKGNQFDGHIPIEICQLTRLSVLDLSNNSLTGEIPGCLGNISLEVTDEKSTFANYIVRRTYADLTMTYDVWFGEKNAFAIDLPVYVALSAVEFTTKGNSYEYEGSILKYMSRIDLSINNLIGQIPYELGNLTEIRALNLSRNNFSGMIPEAFSKLHNIESLDLSHNSRPFEPYPFCPCFFNSFPSAINTFAISKGAHPSLPIIMKKKGDAGPPLRRSLRLAEQARQEMLCQRKLAHGGHEVGDTHEDHLPIPSDEEKKVTASPPPETEVGSPFDLKRF